MRFYESFKGFRTLRIMGKCTRRYHNGGLNLMAGQVRRATNFPIRKTKLTRAYTQANCG